MLIHTSGKVPMAVNMQTKKEAGRYIIDGKEDIVPHYRVMEIDIEWCDRIPVTCVK